MVSSPRETPRLPVSAVRGGSKRGMYRVKVVPSSGELSTVNAPPLCRTTPGHETSDHPVARSAARIERPPQRRGVEIRSADPDLEGDVRTRTERGVPRGEGLVHLGAAGAQAECRRREAGRPGHGRELEQDLLDVRRVGQHRLQTVRQLLVHLDRRCPRSGGLRSACRRRAGSGRAPAGRGAGRRLKARRWRDRIAARSAACRIWARSSRASGGERALVQQEPDVAQDAGQQVVEVVGDAAGELGDLAGPVELRQPLLQRPAIGHVDGAPAVAEELAAGPPGSARPGRGASGTRRPGAASGTRAAGGPGWRRPRRTRPGRRPGRRGAGTRPTATPASRTRGGPVNSVQRLVQVVARAVRPRGPQENREDVVAEARIAQGHADRVRQR